MTETHPLYEMPAARSARLLDFEMAAIISPMIYPARPTLLVNGKKPSLAMRVELVPMAYIRQPDYWGIEVVGWSAGWDGFGPPPEPATIPYAVDLVLGGLTGKIGIEVIGAGHTQQIPLVEHPESDQFLGYVEDGQFRPMFPTWVQDPVVRLTTVGVKDAANPESGELDLAQYNGSMLRVLGHYQDGWIYSATVVERAHDSILSIVARQVFRAGSAQGSAS